MRFASTTPAVKVAAVVAIAMLVGCGDSGGKNNDPIVINNSANGNPNSAANSSTDARCAPMIDGINETGGTACPDGNCNPIPCACADGSTINTSSCINGVCAGLEACESACGEVACGLGGGNNTAANSTANNTSTNNPLNNNNLGGPDDEGMQGDPCTCDEAADPDEDRYKICFGTEDGCDGSFGDPLECVWNDRTNVGTCRAGCTEEEYLTQGSCPAGTICDRFPSLIHDENNPSYFYNCD